MGFCLERFVLGWWEGLEFWEFVCFVGRAKASGEKSGVLGLLCVRFSGFGCLFGRAADLVGKNGGILE